MPPKLYYNYPVSTLLDKAIEKARDRRLVLKSCAKGSAAKANQGPQWAASAAACLVVTSARSLLLDALDPDDTEAGVFTANVRLELVLFGVECLDRVHIGELYENHAIGRRGTAQADRFVKAAGEVLAVGFFDVGLRLGQPTHMPADWPARARRWQRQRPEQSCRLQPLQFYSEISLLPSSLVACRMPDRPKGSQADIRRCHL